MTARQRILDSAEALIGRGGFRAVTIASVAAEADVSRQTVYSHFGTREELITATIDDVSGRALAEIGAALEAIADPGRWVVELHVRSRRQFRTSPALAVLLFPERGNPMFDAELMARGTPIAEGFLAPLFERAPQLRKRRAEVVEIVLRSGLSVLLFDSELTRSDDDLRRFLTRTLLPALGLDG